MWIRSQDKTVLVKVFDFRVDCCIGLDGEFYIQGNLDSNYDSYILGTYKSKERAIEVLDEIQEGMIKNAVAKVVDAEKQYIIPNPVIIYEMPEA